MKLGFAHLLALLSLSACGPAPTPSTAATPSAAPPAAPAAPRLRALGEELFVSPALARYPRGALFYVLAADPVPGSATHPRIGLVQVTEPSAVKVSWYCRPESGALGALGTAGLPVEEFTPDTTIRVGKCWTRYVPKAEAAWGEGAIVDLALNLGVGDHVKAGDMFEILGEPITDTENRTVTGFEKLGLCTVQPFESTFDRAVCRLDRYTSPKFTREWWTRGGYAHLAKAAL